MSKGAQEGGCVTDGPKETNPMTVREAKRGGETQYEWAFSSRARWDWAEPAVWTERMLEALERGVKGGRRHSSARPNAYFITRGLYTLEHAYAQTLQSSRR